MQCCFVGILKGVCANCQKIHLTRILFSADGATLKLDNHKNGWKVVCVYQEHNEDENFIPVRALGSQCVSIRKKLSYKKTYLSEYWVGGRQNNLTSESMSISLKFSATAFNYPSLKGIPIDRLKTSFLDMWGG